MNQITTSKADVILAAENHIRVQVHNNAILEVADIADINNAKFKLVGNNKYTVIFIPGIFASISPEARVFSATREVNHNAIAKALMVTSPADRMISNFFIKINRPPVPTQMFTSEEEAMDWLKKMVEQANLQA